MCWPKWDVMSQKVCEIWSWEVCLQIPVMLPISYVTLGGSLSLLFLLIYKVGMITMASEGDCVYDTK